MEDTDKTLTDPTLNYQPSEVPSLQADNSVALWTAEIIDPVQIGFIPSNSWSAKMQSLLSLRESYFSKKNNVNRRFEHKLWNALRITTLFPNLDKIVGVVWLNEKVIKVYKQPFARLLGITSTDGALFHKQGNFTRHGFVDMTEYEAKEMFTPEQLVDVDFREVHLVFNKEFNFSATATEQDISQCKWDNPAGATRVATIKINP